MIAGKMKGKKEALLDSVFWKKRSIKKETAILRPWKRKKKGRCPSKLSLMGKKGGGEHWETANFVPGEEESIHLREKGKKKGIKKKV